MPTRTRKAPKAKAPVEVVAETPVAEPEPSLTPEPIESIEPLKEAHVESKNGSVTLVYRGTADVLEHGALRIRPGQPVTVPSEVAEELLTWPRERFEVVSQE